MAIVKLSVGLCLLLAAAAATTAEDETPPPAGSGRSVNLQDLARKLQDHNAKLRELPVYQNVTDRLYDWYQQRRQPDAPARDRDDGGRPQARLVHGRLLEPWLNASALHERLQQALVTATLLDAVLEREQPVGAAALLRALADLPRQQEEAEAQLNRSLTALVGRTRSREIQVEALVLELNVALLELADAVSALRLLATNSSAAAREAQLNVVRMTSFINGVTGVMERHLNRHNETVAGLASDVRRLNATRQDAAPASCAVRLDQLSDGLAETAGSVAALHTRLRALDSQPAAAGPAPPEADPAALRAQLTALRELGAADRKEAAALRRQVARLRQQVADGRRRQDETEQRCGRLEERLERLEETLASRPAREQSPQLRQLEASVEQALQPLQGPEESEAFLLTTTGSTRSPPHPAEAGGPAEDGLSRPSQSEPSQVPDGDSGRTAVPDHQQEELSQAVEKAAAPLPASEEEDLGAAGSAAVGRLLQRSDADAPDIITADDLVSADDGGGRVTLGQFIRVTDSVAPRMRQLPPPIAKAELPNSLASLLTSTSTGRPAEPPSHIETGGWRPLPSRDSRKLPPEAPPSPARPDGPAPDVEPAEVATPGPSKPPQDKRPPPVDAASGGGWVGRWKTGPAGGEVVVDPATRKAWFPAARGQRDWGPWNVLDCRPTKKYSRVEGMRDWCLANCPINCPHTHCVCRWGDGEPEREAQRYRGRPGHD